MAGSPNTVPGDSGAGEGDSGAGEVGAYLAAQRDKGLLRFITCGSVDDGKSTLIGRLLYDSKLLFADQIAALETESRAVGTAASGLDFALLVDGLQAEREQGITIDVAYRFFATDRRKFIVADTPGHEQYTRNMATGASSAELAIVLVDARKGVLTQTRRHSHILSLFGVRHVVLAVNKMDLVGYDRRAFERIVGEYRALAAQLGLTEIVGIPVSATGGDNVLTVSENMPWHGGPTLMAHLETVEIASDRAALSLPLRMPVQWVNRPNPDFRGFAGTIVSGVAQVGQDILVAPSGKTGRIARILAQDGERRTAIAGEAVTLTLTDEIDIVRGDTIAAADRPPETSDQIQAHILWMDAHSLLPGRDYELKIGTCKASAVVSDLKHTIDVNTQERIAGKILEMNEVGLCNLFLDRTIAFDSYEANRETGGFILVDRFTNNTVGAGTIDFGLRRAANIAWQEIAVDKGAHARLKGQKPCVLWFTGLSGSGKSTVANLVEKRLYALGRHSYILDGDNVRHGLNKDLGFTEADRVENIRRIAEVAKLFVGAGIIALVAFISPFRNERRMAREALEPDEFLEVFVDTPLKVCERRDPKGLYKKARAGKIPNFTGIDSPYEPPENAEIRLDTTKLSQEEAAETVIEALRKTGAI